MALNEHDLDVEGRLSSLETDMLSLKGNGQPGRVGKLEDAVKKLTWFLALGIGGLYAIVFCAAQGWISFVPKVSQGHTTAEQQSNASSLF